MSETSKGTKWCGYYNCWCSDVEEITDGECDCELFCEICDDLEYVE